MSLQILQALSRPNNYYAISFLAKKARNPHLCRSPLGGKTALHYACQFNPLLVPHIIKILKKSYDMEYEINCTPFFSSFTPLHFACKHNPQAVPPLLFAGADPLRKTRFQKKTPLDILNTFHPSRHPKIRELLITAMENSIN